MLNCFPTRTGLAPGGPCKQNVASSPLQPSSSVCKTSSSLHQVNHATAQPVEHHWSCHSHLPSSSRHYVLPPPCAIPKATPEGSTQQPAGTAQQQDWSQRLLDVTKKKKDAHRAPVSDIFVPPSTSTQKTSKQRNSSWGNDVDDEDVAYEDEPQGKGGKRLPAEMRCFDTARIFVQSGDGGNGCVAFRREKFVEHGGPAGGTGGRGGNIWAIADPQYNSLTTFRTKVHWRAPSGGNGTGSNCDGADASDMYVPVPLGTIIRRKDAEEGEAPLAELVAPGEKALLLVGGRGGRGNYAFKTARNTAPTIAERGEKGIEMWVDLELRVVADVGIIGVPNAGKSTLLSVLTAARPKIADYPFTTLVPNLGVCERDYRTTVFADVPGLLEGAHEGLGLGHEFLRHVSRCRALVHVIDGCSPDPVGDWSAINLELELFNPDLKDKPQLVAYNKVDVPESGEFWEDVKEALVAQGMRPDRILPISAATGSGVTELVRAVHSLLDELGPSDPLTARETDAQNVTQVPRREHHRVDDFTIEVEEVLGSTSPQGGPLRVYYVQGTGITKFAQMTNWNYWDAVRRFQRTLDAAGIDAGLLARGIREGDTVVIGDMEFEWSNDRSQGALYEAWLEDMKARGTGRQGVARWPHQRPKNTK